MADSDPLEFQRLATRFLREYQSIAISGQNV